MCWSRCTEREIRFWLAWRHGAHWRVGLMLLVTLQILILLLYKWVLNLYPHRSFPYRITLNHRGRAHTSLRLSHRDLVLGSLIERPSEIQCLECDRWCIFRGTEERYHIQKPCARRSLFLSTCGQNVVAGTWHRVGPVRSDEISLGTELRMVSVKTIRLPYNFTNIGIQKIQSDSLVLTRKSDNNGIEKHTHSYFMSPGSRWQGSWTHGQTREYSKFRQLKLWSLRIHVRKL